jgi:tetratricopeptide (TPR) repeat protein
MRSLIDSAAEAIGTGNLAQAESLSRQALEASPDDAAARLILGVVLARTRRLLEEIEQLDRVLAVDPNSVEALIWSSDALRKVGRFEEALGRADHATQLDPLKPDSLFTAAMCLLALGRYPESELRLRKVLSFSRAPLPLHYLGVALMRQEKLTDSIQVLEEAKRLEPRHPIHLVAIGQARLLERKYLEARQMAVEALSIAPDHPGANLLMAQVMAQDGMPSECEAYIARVLAANPNSAEAHGLMGMFHQQMGHFSQAEWHLDRSLEIDPNQATPLFCKVQNLKVDSSHRDLVERMIVRTQSPTTSLHERIVLEYALGKAFDDLKMHAEAMQHIEVANRASCEVYRRSDPWDPHAFEHLVDRSIELFTASFLDEFRSFGNPTAQPIFVLGMIRSGTTLMEQMLSSHRRVTGAGEVWFWMDEGPKCLTSSGKELDPARMSQMSAMYLEVLARVTPGDGNVTDKMPGNVTVLGFIHACLPNAKIIHMVRDPIDNCLSIWTTYFRKPPEFGNHKGNIIHAFRQHERLRAHWKGVIPTDRFLEVSYEALATDPDHKMREVLDFCGLDWDPACIRPQDNERFVSTPSVWRVRRPVDTASVNKRQRYGDLLGEFLELEINP